jgi:glycosyltransferase involved in cell wall biosynthesis
MTEWHILTGEYPPQSGGVSDYSRLVACALAQAGDVVRIWAPPCSGTDPSDPGVCVHRLPDHFGPKSLGVLDSVLRRPNSTRRLLLQYVPQAFGYKGMNLPFCVWLYSRRRRERIWVMFHEVAYPFRRKEPVLNYVLAAVNHLMAAIVSRAAQRCFASTLAWFPLIRKLHPRRRIEWLPIPSSMPTEVPLDAGAAVRARYGAGGGRPLVGHFGTFGKEISPLVENVLPKVVAADPKRLGLLIGRRSEQVLPRMLQSRPDLEGRLFATGPLPSCELAASLAACDLLVQPYPDGVTTRRTTLMAPLALGVPVVTTYGALTEPFWHQESLVALAPVESPEEMAVQADKLLNDPTARRRLANSAQNAYRRMFAIERTVQVIHNITSVSRDPKESAGLTSLPLQGKVAE